MNLELKLKNVVSKILGVKNERIFLESRFIEDLDADSLDKVELILALEEDFGIKIEDGDADLIESVEDALIFIKKNLKI